MVRTFQCLVACAMVSLVGAVAVGADGLTGLVGYWPFDGDVLDASGNGHDGELEGDELYDDGVFGQALSLDGFENWVSVGDWDPSEGTGELTVALWANWDESNSQNNMFVTKRGTWDEVGLAWQFVGKNDGSALFRNIPTILRGGAGPGFEWVHWAATFDGLDAAIYRDGEIVAGPTPFEFTGGADSPISIGARSDALNENFMGLLDDVRIYNRALPPEDLEEVMNGVAPGGEVALQPGDADQDLDFDQLDLVQVQIAAKYLSGQAATWGEGDWDGGPGGTQSGPPPGNGLFDQLDIIAALSAGKYLTGPYAALAPEGTGSGRATIVYNVDGTLSVDVPGAELTSINIDSATGMFTGEAAQNLGGSFDNDDDNNIFKATFGNSFGSLSFGLVAQAGLSQEFVQNDLSAVGSLLGGGDLGIVDMRYVPEPSATLLLALGLAAMLVQRWRPCSQFSSRKH